VLLGVPIAQRGGRLVAWDLRRSTDSLLGGMSAGARRALAQRLFDAPRLYLSSDVEPLTNRGDRHITCANATVTLVNPGSRRARQLLEVTLTRRRSAARQGQMIVDGRAIPISAGRRAHVVAVELSPGTTEIEISVHTPGVRCQSVPVDSLPAVSASLRPVPGSA
jgi:hypothetical protein